MMVRASASGVSSMSTVSAAVGSSSVANCDCSRLAGM